MMATGGRTKVVHTRKLWLRVPKSEPLGRWKFKQPLDGIRPSRLLPLFPAVAKPRTKPFQRRYFWWRFCGLYSSFSTERWKQTSGCRTHFLYWFISKSSNGAGFVRETRLLPSPPSFCNKLRMLKGFCTFKLTPLSRIISVCSIFSLYQPYPQARDFSVFLDGGAEVTGHPSVRPLVPKVPTLFCLTCFCIPGAFPFTLAAVARYNCMSLDTAGAFANF